MKTNIRRVNSYLVEDAAGSWYMWSEYCDKCGKFISEKNIILNKSPNVEEMDLCEECFKISKKPVTN